MEDEVVGAADTVSARPQTPPKKVFAPQPAYPEGARQAALEGTVILRGRVSAQGDVRRAEVLRGAAPALDRAALEAFRTWQFQPALRDGRPVESDYQVAIHFNLERPAAAASIEGRTPAAGAVANGAGSAAGNAAVRAGELPTEPEGPLPVDGEFDPPERIYAPLPKYPASAWATGASGDVLLMIVVNERGTVDEIQVMRGLPHGITEAAVDAVRRWRFRPASRDGEAVSVYHRLRLRFTP